MAEPGENRDQDFFDAISRRHLEKSDMGQETPRAKQITIGTMPIHTDSATDTVVHDNI